MYLYDYNDFYIINNTYGFSQDLYFIFNCVMWYKITGLWYIVVGHQSELSVSKIAGTMSDEDIIIELQPHNGANYLHIKYVGDYPGIKTWNMHSLTSRISYSKLGVLTSLPD